MTGVSLLRSASPRAIARDPGVLIDILYPQRYNRS
jgi:hypothetical protein